MKKLKLQGLGEVPAIDVSEVRPGMLVSWNQSWKAFEVVRCEKVGKMWEFVERDRKTGREFTRKFRDGRLIAAGF